MKTSQEITLLSSLALAAAILAALGSLYTRHQLAERLAEKRRMPASLEKGVVSGKMTREIADALADLNQSEVAILEGVYRM